MMPRFRTVLLAVTLSLAPLLAGGLQWGGGGRTTVVSSRNVDVTGGAIQLDFGEGRIDLGEDVVQRRVADAARAVATYFGRFPVKRARVLVIPAADGHGVFQGTTWGNRGGFQGFTRIRIGEHTTQKELTEDWMMTHELVHMAFPNLEEEHHWMEEGMATYVEPIARVQAGQMEAKTIWRDMVDGMPKGEPGERSGA